MHAGDRTEPARAVHAAGGPPSACADQRRFCHELADRSWEAADRNVRGARLAGGPCSNCPRLVDPAVHRRRDRGWRRRRAGAARRGRVPAPDRRIRGPARSWSCWTSSSSTSRCHRCSATSTPGAARSNGSRLVQGVGAALVMPNVLSIIGEGYSGPDRARALGVYGLVMGIAAVSGQLIGGALVQADLFGLGWRSCFFDQHPGRGARTRAGAAAGSRVARPAPQRA